MELLPHALTLLVCYVLLKNQPRYKVARIKEFKTRGASGNNRHNQNRHA